MCGMNFNKIYRRRWANSNWACKFKKETKINLYIQ